MSAPMDREAVARIIDPEAFAYEPQTPSQFMARARVRAKADAILALTDARVRELEGALETFAIMANEDTAYLPDEHVITLSHDDSKLDDELGGPNTLLGERFMRAFRQARAALAEPTTPSDRGAA